MNTTYTLSPSACLFHADCRDAIRALPDNSIDAGVMDPPYALVSIIKRFGSPNAAPAKGNDAYMRASAGFMGKTWDTGEVAFDPSFWAEVLRVLKPGAHLVAFGASRGYHRMACAIEDAGFEIRDSLQNLIDPVSPLAAFLDSLNEAQHDAFVRCVDHMTPGGPLAWLYGTGFPKSHDVSKGIDAKLLAGSARTEDMRKLAMGDNYEPSERGRENYDHGGGSVMNGASGPYLPRTPEAAEWEGWGTALKPAFEPIVLARKPLSESTVAANVLRWGTGALNIDACRIHTGESTARTYTAKRTAPGATQNATGERKLEGVEFQGQSKEGRWPANVLHDGSDEVVGAFPAQAGAAAPASGKSLRGVNTSVARGKYNGLSDGRTPAFHDDSGSAARFFYSAKASKADRNGSKHPTVKPISALEWLCHLVTPPGGTILDAFAGSGTTGAAARNLGFNVIMCEREAEYVADIRRRFGWIESPPLVPEDSASSV